MTADVQAMDRPLLGAGARVLGCAERRLESHLGKGTRAAAPKPRKRLLPDALRALNSVADRILKSLLD